MPSSLEIYQITYLSSFFHYLCYSTDAFSIEGFIVIVNEGFFFNSDKTFVTFSENSIHLESVFFFFFFGVKSRNLRRLSSGRKINFF